MDILLGEILTPNPGKREAAPEARAELPEFASPAPASLHAKSGSAHQVAEFKEFISNIPIASLNPENPASVLPGDPQTSLEAPVESDRTMHSVATAVPASLETMLPALEESISPDQAVIRSPVPGEFLPADGNILPRRPMPVVQRNTAVPVVAEIRPEQQAATLMTQASVSGSDPAEAESPPARPAIGQPRTSPVDLIPNKPGQPAPAVQPGAAGVESAPKSVRDAAVKTDPASPPAEISPGDRRASEINRFRAAAGEAGRSLGPVSAVVRPIDSEAVNRASSDALESNRPKTPLEPVVSNTQARPAPIRSPVEPLQTPRLATPGENATRIAPRFDLEPGLTPESHNVPTKIREVQPSPVSRPDLPMTLKAMKPEPAPAANNRVIAAANVGESPPIPQAGSAIAAAVTESIPARLPEFGSPLAVAAANPPSAQPAVPAGYSPVIPGASASPPVALEPLGLARNTDSLDWGNGLGERVSWMINQKHNSATIRLDPPLLGKLDVQVRVSDDAMLITIQTQHAQTRDLIDAASFRLRDFLQEQGFQNVNVDVSQQRDQQARSANSRDDQALGGDEFGADAPDRESPRVYASRGEGLIDTFV